MSAQGPLQWDIFDANCPSRDVLRDVTGRWAPLVLIALADGESRFGDLHKAIKGSNERMLVQTLVTLGEDSLVDRELDLGGRPLYRLTEAGAAVAGKLMELRDTLYRHLDQEKAAGALATSAQR